LLKNEEYFEMEYSNLINYLVGMCQIIF
jgi:hypothetical protein